MEDWRNNAASCQQQNFLPDVSEDPSRSAQLFLPGDIKKEDGGICSSMPCSHIEDHDMMEEDQGGDGNIKLGSGATSPFEVHETSLKTEQLAMNLPSGSGSSSSKSTIEPKKEGSKLHLTMRPRERYFSSDLDSPDKNFCSSTTQPNGDLNESNAGHEEENADGGDGPRRICLVCGDVASGFHYGVASCEACKAFFKRTIQGNIEYTCPASNDCEINKRRRKACQACRFQKCLRMGMLKEGVRLDRVRGGRQKYRRNSDMPYPARTMSPRKASLEDNKMITALTACETELPLTNTLDPTLYETQTRTVSILSDLYDREIISIIGWAKQVPGFTELTLNDQMRLLQSTWTEILTFSIAFRSLTMPGKLLFAADFSLDEKQARTAGIIDLFLPCYQVVERLERVSIMKEEYCLMKALVLVNADTRIEDFQSVKKLRESILSALTDCVTVLRPSSPTIHVNSLLLCLPILRQSDLAIKKFWLTVRREGKVCMNKLFVEMLEAHYR